MKIKMPFSSEDKVIIKQYCLDKGYDKRITEFPNCDWTLSTLRNLIKNIEQTG